MLCEMQSVSSRIWTRVAVSISYDDNHYTTGTSVIVIFIQIYSTQRMLIGTSDSDQSRHGGNINEKILHAILFVIRSDQMKPYKGKYMIVIIKSDKLLGTWLLLYIY